MGSLNKVQLIANLTADPEIRYATSGTAVGNIRVATTERIRDANGEWTNKPEYHRVVCFSAQAENAGKYLAKGRQVYVEGRLQTREWEDANGVKRWSTEIVASNIQYLGANPNAAQNGNADKQQQDAPAPAPAATQAEPPPPPPINPESGLPF
jgi:single-strand DNA-binding protein